MRSRLAARRRGLQRPALSLWTCFRAPPRSSRWIGPMSPASPELRNSTSALIGKSYIAAVRPVWPSTDGPSFRPRRVLKEMDEGTGLTPEAVKELRRVTDLALRATKHTAATTLRVYVAAIAARRELDEIPLGRHRMVSAFMRGVRRLGRFAPRQFFLGTYQSSSKV